MQIWIHDSKMRKIVALNNDIPDMLSYTNSAWHPYLDQATSTFDFTIPKFSNGELHEDIKLINDECFVSFYVNDSYQVFYIATLQEDDFNIQLTCNNTNLEYALEYANPFNSSSAQSIQWYLEHMDLLSFAAVEIGNNEISDRKRTLTFDSQETKMNRLQSLMSKFEAEFEFKVELNRDGTYKRIVINIYQEADDTHHGIGTDRKDVVLYYSNGLKGVQVTSDKTQMFNAGVFDGKDGVNLANVEFSEKNADGVEEFYSRKGDIFVYAPLSMQRYPATMRPDGQDNWIRKDFQTEYENVNDLKAYALRTLKKYAYPLVTYTASVQSGFVSHYTDLKLGDTIRIIDKNFVGGLALEARVSEMIISFDNPANNSFVFTNYRKLDNKPSAALQTRIEQAVESKLPYRIELATTGGVAFKNNEGETIVKPSLYKGNLPYTKDVSWHWALGGVATVGTQYRIQARDITDSEVLTVAAYVGNLEVATTEITLTNVNDGVGVESIDRYFTSSDQSDGVTIEGAQWSDKPPAPTEDGKYLWAYDEITYTDGTVTTTKPAAVGANFDVDAFRAEIAEDLKDVPNREEFENKIAEELANSKAEITTQIETAKTQAESNAKEYADTINQETAKVAEQANTAADEIKADLVNVKNNLTSTSLVANNAQAAVDAAKQELANVTSDLNTAKQDLADSVSAVNTKVDSAKAELTQAKQQLTTVSDDLSKAKTDFQNAVSAVDTKATNLQSDLTQAKQDLISQAQQLQEQASAQSELTKRVSSVEKTANGTKTTVSELSKTVDQNGKDITSVTARTKVVEDDLSGTKTTLSQVKTTADSTSQKTATLESGLDGLTARFDNLKIGGTNLLLYSSDPWQAPSGYYQSSGAVRTEELLNGSVVYKTRSIWSRLAMNWGKHLIDKPDVKVGDEFTYSVYVRTDQESPIKARLFFRYSGQSSAEDMTGEKTITQEWQRFTKTFTVTQKMVSDSSKLGWVGFEQTSNSEDGKFVYYACNKLERGNVATDYSPNDADIEQKIAEYKQNADQNYASLQTTVQNLDGTVQQNKATAEQTAQGFKTRIESLETYKDGETTRANQYFESAKTETARQLTAERTAIAKDYVAKSTYTSDVTGIRNDLTATTTTANTIKTNLANYQASNDRAVANLQSNMQTANGNISSLKTKVEAVPGQITSAVSAVEGKIPTSVGSTNLLLYSADPSKAPSGYYDFTNAKKTNETYSGSVVYRVRGIWGGLRVNLGNLVDRGLLKVGDVLTYSVAMRAERNTPIQARLFVRYTNQSDADSPTGKIELVNLTADWQYVSVTFTVTAKMLAENTKVTYLGWELTSSTESGKYVYYACNKIERGNVATDWSSAPEDAIKEISNLSSEIKQTADGITLLATKTELSTAKNDLQSGINTATNKANSAQNKANSNAQTISTHTTQISALNTGLSAKVSQSDFNTLSGRVTTAENNITAKANELTSKITSVEGAIEDTQSDITKLSSEIKQTADGMTLLATKTELNTAKSDLQSGINTATSKANSAQNTANSAQSTANSNAQTISTHTTQISALNTGLSAKVSQSDFNTLSGRVTTAENNITAKANELSSKITSVEGKIPTNVGGRNYIRNYGLTATGWSSHNSGWKFEIISDSTAKSGQYLKATCTTASTSSFNGFYKNLFDFSDGRFFGKQMTWSMDVKTSKNTKLLIGCEWGNAQDNVNTTNNWQRFSKTFKVATSSNQKAWIFYSSNWNVGDIVYIRDVQLEDGSIATSPVPAIEDTESDISAVSSELKQTADGMTLLATKTELNTAKSDLQSGISTATNKANTAQNTANNAQSTANNNAQTISTHTTQISALNTGLSAKVSQSDFNTLSGRVTSAENNIIAKANELSSKITSVEGKIPTEIGTVNLIKGTGSAFAMGGGITNTTWNETKKQTILDFSVPGVDRAKGGEILPLNGKFFDFKPIKGTTYTQSIMIDTDATFNPNGQAQCSWFTNNGHNQQKAYIKKVGVQSYQVWSTYTWNLENTALRAFDWFGLHNVLGFRNSGTYLAFYKPKLTAGNLPSDWSPAPEDTSSQISSLSSEFKQTTDAIKASVTSLDKSTVKSSSLTINADGIVMKAGKSTSDFANAVGSYFSVNQNAINLFSDKINVKGNMIVNGAITSDKIASKSINTAHLNGKIITADVISSNAVTADAIKAGAVTTDKMSANSINGDRITAGTLDAAKIKAGSITASQIASGTITSSQIKSGTISAANIAAGAITSDKIAANSISSDKIVANGITANVIKGGTLQSVNGSTNFELNTGKLFYNNNNTGVFRVQNGASTMGLKFSNTSLTVSGTSRILSRIILGGDRRETTLDDGKWDKGGFSGLVIETIKGVEPATNEHADALRAISDTIYFTHTYSADSPTGISAHGWKMETYAPNSSYSGNIVLKPYGINSRQSDIVVGDIRLDNGDGSGYWMRATINTLKACFGHILNGGISSQALNAIRSELNKISGT